jgi:hypothetical protein
MMDFQIEPSAASTPTTRREIPGQLKAVLGLKVLSCLAAIGISLVALLEWSDPANRPVGMSSELAHRIANLAMLATGVSLLELLGVAGVWSFKRWGVYILAGFSMLSFVIRLHNGDNFGIVSIASTVVAGAVIATRWKDFE